MIGFQLTWTWTSVFDALRSVIAKRNALNKKANG